VTFLDVPGDNRGPWTLWTRARAASGRCHCRRYRYSRGLILYRPHHRWFVIVSPADVWFFKHSLQIYVNPTITWFCVWFFFRPFHCDHTRPHTKYKKWCTPSTSYWRVVV
jgi:hypothetical protein